MFKEIFDKELNIKYDTVMKQYSDLRQNSQVCFEERVHDAMEGMNSRNIASRLNPANFEIYDTRYQRSNGEYQYPDEEGPRDHPQGDQG